MSKYNIKALTGSKCCCKCIFEFADSHWRLQRFKMIVCFPADHKLPAWGLCNLVSMLNKRKMPNKRQSLSARGTQLYLQTAFTSRTLAVCGIEQMDDKSVSNEGKLIARCQCQCFRGSSANLFTSFYSRQSVCCRLEQEKQLINRVWISLRCKCSVKLLVLLTAATVVHATLSTLTARCL